MKLISKNKIINLNINNIKNPFKRRLTAEYIRKHYTKRFESRFEGHLIGEINENECGILETLGIDIRGNRFCLVRGYNYSSYWLIDVEYVSDLKKLIKLYKVRKTSN